LPRVSESAVEKLLSASDAVFVDARFSRDFQEGHLDGAINVPVDANDTEPQRITGTIPKDSKIVGYCQSKGCGFAEQVALQLRDAGFLNVALYRGAGTSGKLRTPARPRMPDDKS
jgi:rhodanese-related sulfurtransferase